MKKIIKLYLGFCLAAFLLTVWSLECRAAEEYTDLTEGAEYSDEIPLASENSAVNEEKGIIKEQIQGIIDYAKGLFMEAKSDSVTEDGNWLNGDIIVVILCVATVLIILIYVIFDFIRSPWKKKIKILLELIIAISLVGGILWYFWNQAVEEQQKSGANDSYQEEMTLTGE